MRAAPSIPNLTEHLQTISDTKWLELVNRLRRLKLIAPESRHRPETLDAHPLVREHFGKQVKKQYPEAWKEGNNRLYEYYKTVAKEFPDTIEEMMPLFAAVQHGCQAGKYQEALDEVYWKRITREQEQFVVSKLGAFGADLAALVVFFDPPWHKPVDGLRESDKGFVLGEAGYDLGALGRLAEAAQPMQASLDAAVVQQDWMNASIRASNLSELYLAIGNVTQALVYARQSVKFADRSGDEFERMTKRVRIADALHQAGRLTEAEAAFREAEEMQNKRQPKSPLLYSLQGYQYCDLLLSQGDYTEVQRRASQTVQYAKQDWYSLLSIAFDNLSLGRAHLLQSQREPNHLFTKSLTYLNRAVDGFRHSGDQDELPRGLLAPRSIIALQVRWIRHKRIWMKPSPSLHAAAWVCILPIAIWSMRGWRWQDLIPTLPCKGRAMKPASIGKLRRI